MKEKLLITLTIVLAGFFATACEKKQQASTEKPRSIAGIATEKISLATVDDFYEATGTVKSKTTTALSSKIMGAVLALHAREGDTVRAGQTLIEIDNRDANAQLQKAQAGLREAEQAVAEVEQSASAAESAKNAAEANRKFAAATFARYQALLERKAISPQEFDEVRAKHQVAEAEVERAERMLQTLAARKKQIQARIDQAKADISNAQIYVGYARITSPMAGIVTAKPIEVGAMAAPGVPLLTIEDNANYRLEANVDESQLGKIRLREKAQVQIDALGEDFFEGTVAEIVPTADAASRSYTVKIELSAKPTLRTGLYGKARFITGQKQALTVAQKSLVQQGQLTGVYVVDDNHIARFRLIKTGKTLGDRVEVLSGLNDGERIVVDNVAQVSDGIQLQ
ncbi:MAG: efflux RND transporter periplasmic adaptor subunit [Acidobacteriota bacterium]